jgi:hypothetical protein
MSDPRRDDRDGNDALGEAWRAHSNELPPQRLDAAILAAAHREVHAQPTPLSEPAVAQARKPGRAWWGLAAAATIGAIAFGVLQQQPQETPSTPTTASDVPAPREEQKREQAPAQPPVASEPAAAAPAPPPPARTTESPSPKRRDAPSDVAAPAAPPPPAFVPPPDTPLPKSVESPRVAATSPPPAVAEPAPAAPEARAFPGSPGRAEKAEAPRQRESESAAGARVAAAPRAPAELAADAARGNADVARKPSAPLALQATLSPDAWIARIDELLRAGRRDEAARELRAFRGAHADADARLPESLRAWAASVPRE